jgi:hypothetical protein
MTSCRYPPRSIAAKDTSIMGDVNAHGLSRMLLARRPEAEDYRRPPDRQAVRQVPGHHPYRSAGLSAGGGKTWTLIRFAEVPPGRLYMVAQIVRQPIRIVGRGVGHDRVIAKSWGSGGPPHPSTATSMAVKPRGGVEEKSRRMGSPSDSAQAQFGWGPSRQRTHL